MEVSSDRDDSPDCPGRTVLISRGHVARPQPLVKTDNAIARTIEVRTVVIPSIPLVEARERFLTDLRWKTSKLSGRRLTDTTAAKYRSWLKRFERWLLENGLPLDLGGLTEDHLHDFQGDLLDEIDQDTLEESSASTYVRCIKTLFSDTWRRLHLDPVADPSRNLQAGSQQSVDFPLFQPEHVRSLVRAAVRPRGPNIPEWLVRRDQTLLACFFDLGWRVGEASLTQTDHVDLRTGLVTIPRRNVKMQHRGRVVGLNQDTGRLLKAWIETWRPAVPNNYLFVTDEGRQLVPDAIRKLFRRLGHASGIGTDTARVSPHTCRHYFAVQWARAHPGDLAGLQRVLGHSSIRTTQIYFERAEDLGAVERQQAMRSNWR